MAELNLGISDYAVSRAIIELQQDHDLINAELIADHINGSPKTVFRSISRLKKIGYLIVKSGSARSGGFRYEYTGE